MGHLVTQEKTNVHCAQVDFIVRKELNPLVLRVLTTIIMVKKHCKIVWSALLELTARRRLQIQLIVLPVIIARQEFQNQLCVKVVILV